MSAGFCYMRSVWVSGRGRYLNFQFLCHLGRVRGSQHFVVSLYARHTFCNDTQGTQKLKLPLAFAFGFIVLTPTCRVS
jgi:hypothetical protein